MISLRTKLVFAIFCVFTFTRCEYEPSPMNTSKATQQFFDIKGFFENEIQHLQKANPRVIKLVAIDQHTETKELKGVDFKKELDLFIKSDINKPAWSDKYIADSLFESNKALTSIKYRSKDPNLKIQFIEVTFDESREVSQITIHNQVNSLIAKTNEVLRYEVGKGYSIENEQSILTTKPKRLKIEAQFQF